MIVMKRIVMIYLQMIVQEIVKMILQEIVKNIYAYFRFTQNPYITGLNIY